MSNRKTNQPDSPVNPPINDGGGKIWRSLGELESTERFQNALDHEFVDGSAQMETEEEREMSRRSFVKLMGASSALAGLGLAACRRPESLIVPFAESPEWSIPGKPVYFASSMPRAHGAVPLVVTTHDGRPTKLEPNKLFDKQGGTDSFTQASILDMYDPARSRAFMQKGARKTRADFEKALGEIVAKPDTRIAFVFGEDESPTRSRLVKELKAKYAGARFYSYEPLTGEERKQANAEAFGKGADVVADFSEAKVVLSLDSDFLELDQQGPVSGFYNNRFIEGADYTKKADAKAMNRLYIVEGGFSLTGGMADHRMRIAPSQIPAIAAEIAKHIPGASVTLTGGPKLTPTQEKWAKACADDLKANAGKSVVLAGSRQTKALQNICIAINNALGNYGKTLKPVLTERGEYGDMEALVNSLNAREFDTVVLLTPANPAYDADGFAAAAKNAQVIHLGLRTDATANAADWHVPAAHYLESWSDARTALGTLTVVQPLILPLYNGVSELDLLLAFLDGKLFDSAADGESASVSYEAVKKTFVALADDSEKSWLQFLRDGFWKNSTYAAVAPKGGGTVSVTMPKAPSIDSLEVVFTTDGSLYDGRYANNAWLQEAPDPITKVCWDNVAVVSPKTATDMGLYEKILKLQPKGKVYGIEAENAGVGPDGEGRDHANPVVKLTVNGRELEVPVMIGFGHADDVVSISLGYGQGFNQHDELKRDTANEKNVSLVSVNTGFNAYTLRTGSTPYLAFGGKVVDANKRYSIAMTQEHHAMYGRALAREVSTIATDGDHGKDFAAQLEGVKTQGMDSHAPENISLYKGKGSDTWHDKAKADKHLFDERQQWAMTIDLNNCIGCNACLVACQAENSIPVVGKEQVAMGREMHWIRMDRYFAAVEREDENGKKFMDESNPEMIPQPVACMQCEAAPCETVCPVNATVHSEDGLNTMAYNRCIGTRYCANNCPYKARRFNFFDYNKRNPLIHKNLYKGPGGKKAVGEAPHLQRNPNVTVRMRGVMEKCTYCVQRIQSAKGKVKANLKNKATMAGGSSVDVKINDSELRPKLDSVKVACQDACPASAITFGNLQDGDKAQVVRSRNSARNYELLHYIGTLPRTTYLARVKNPNPEMPDAKGIGRATITMH
ncbi:MAG: TAT-variant-translocated molybdopterin oxidoreductase [Akkermansiaceae bacterium]|nr:TAT-variant-translocated molybdopterin oxidoreductase [Akkermansiaceae bacterium]